MSDGPIYYFDNNATTRVAPEVVEAMLPFLTEQWGNPSSAYSFGNEVGEAVDNARAQVAALINAEPREIIFTSCGTESKPVQSRKTRLRAAPLPDSIPVQSRKPRLWAAPRR